MVFADSARAETGWTAAKMTCSWLILPILYIYRAAISFCCTTAVVCVVQRPDSGLQSIMFRNRQLVFLVPQSPPRYSGIHSSGILFNFTYPYLQLSASITKRHKDRRMTYSGSRTLSVMFLKEIVDSQKSQLTTSHGISVNQT